MRYQKTIYLTVEADSTEEADDKIRHALNLLIENNEPDDIEFDDGSDDTAAVDEFGWPLP